MTEMKASYDHDYIAFQRHADKVIVGVSEAQRLLHDFNIQEFVDSAVTLWSIRDGGRYNYVKVCQSQVRHLARVLDALEHEVQTARLVLDDALAKRGADHLVEKGVDTFSIPPKENDES